MTEKNEELNELLGTDVNSVDESAQPEEEAQTASKPKRRSRAGSNAKKAAAVPPPPTDAEMRERIADLERRLKDKEAEKEALRAVVDSSIVVFEGEIQHLEQVQRNLAAIMAEAPRDLEEVVIASDASGRAVKTAYRETMEYWTAEQKEAKKSYDRNSRELDKLYDRLVAVTLVDDPDLFGPGTPVGVNGELRGVYHTTEYYTPQGTKSDKRVHCIEYKFYKALKDSYRIKHRTIIDDHGKKKRVPVKVCPIVHAEIPSPEQLKIHAERAKGKGIRAEMRRM